MWHSEFGRMPISQRGVGRDHNPGAMTVFLAGAGIQGGQKIGATDESVTRPRSRSSRRTTCTPRSCTCSEWTTSG